MEAERRDDDDPIEQSAPLDIRTPFVGVKSALVRDWVRAALVPSAVKRLYEIGMGQTKFAVATEAGNVVHVEAPASVQTRALQGIIAIGVPQQLGLMSDDDEVPGVIAVGEWELAGARGEAHEASRQLSAGDTGGEIGPVDTPQPTGTIADALGDVLGDYVAPAGHSVVLVEDAEESNDARADEPPPPVDPDRNALAKEILARRRAARQNAHAGPRAGDHPNHSGTPLPSIE